MFSDSHLILSSLSKNIQNIVFRMCPCLKCIKIFNKYGIIIKKRLKVELYLSLKKFI